MITYIEYPYFLNIYYYTLVLVYKIEYVHVLYVWSHTQYIYYNRWSSMMMYTSYIPFIRLDTSYIMRYIYRSSYKRV
jgi:hypothetical protein